jgi:hypothetical protein
VPWPERVLSVGVESPWGDVEIHTVGIPPGVSNGWLKVEMFEGIHGCLARQPDCRRILCGDLNSRQAESADGQITTWGQVINNGIARTWMTWRDSHGRVDTGARWVAAERNVLACLAPFDLSDVFRTLNGYGVQE